MAYTLPEKRAILEFEEYPGLEVTVRVSPVPMGPYFDIVKLMEETDRDVSRFRDLAERFAPIGLIGWNLPEPATAEGIVGQPFDLALAIVLQWSKAVASVPLPLPRRSSDGEPSEDPTTSPQS